MFILGNLLFNMAVVLGEHIMFVGKFVEIGFIVGQSCVDLACLRGKVSGQVVDLSLEVRGVALLNTKPVQLESESPDQSQRNGIE